MGILDLSNGEHEDCVILAGFVPLQAGFITVAQKMSTCFANFER